MKIDFYKLTKPKQNHLPRRMYRTLESTIFDLVVMLLTLVMWGIAIYAYIHNSTEIIQWNFTNQAGDKMGNHFFPVQYESIEIFIICAVGTISLFICQLSTYYPRLLNLPVRIINSKQLKLAILNTRIISILTAILFINIVSSVAFHFTNRSIYISSLVIAGLMIMTLALFSFLIYKNKH